MRLVAKLLGLAFFGGIAVVGAPPAEAFLVTQPQASSNATLCVDVKEALTAVGTVVWAYPCNGTVAEQWNWVGSELQGLMPGRCLGTKGGAHVNGTPVILTSCTAKPRAGQSWGYFKQAIYLLDYNECLDSAPGPVKQLVIRACSATSPTQQWTLH
jgi:hypothetical protein